MKAPARFERPEFSDEEAHSIPSSPPYRRSLQRLVAGIAVATMVAIPAITMACSGGRASPSPTSTEANLVIGSSVGQLPPVASQTALAGTGQPSCKQSGHVSWVDGADNFNRKVAVVGPVDNVTDNGDAGTKLTLGNSPGSNLDVVLLQTALSQLPAKPSDLYEDKTICVTGVIEPINGVPTIYVDQPKDISVF